MAINARRNVRIDATNLKAHLRDFAKVMGKELSEVIRDQAAAFCLDMIKNTRPMVSRDGGMERAAKEKGELNVRNSIYHIFRPVERATAGQIAAIGRYDVFKLWEKRNGGAADSGKARKLRWDRFREAFGGGKAIPFVEAGDAGALGSIHTRLRRDDGRGSLKEYAINAKEPFAIVAREKDIDAYANAKARDVGLLKSAYYHAALRIKGRIKGAAWVKHPQGAVNAIGEDKTGKNLTPFVVVGNSKGRKGITDSLVQNVLNRRGFAMRNAMARELTKRKTPMWAATAVGDTSGTGKYFS